MSQWIINGLRAGIKTTGYPHKSEEALGTTPGRPCGTELDPRVAQELAARCPTGALTQVDDGVHVDYRRCTHCYRCRRNVEHPVDWKQSFEWAGAPDGRNEFGPEFKRSIHIIVVDAGDCGACLNEVKQLNNPYYNMHRLGFFITPSPRHADVLLVVGPVTDHLRFALRKIYEAMPRPKKVIAVGACALSGSVFGESFVCAEGVAEVLPVDVKVPGHPPPPLAILHGLLVATDRKPPASLVSPTTAAETHF
jgi:Ni,Fe-hydrogenase III small subunit